MAKLRISFGSHYKFPLKLYQVVNDGLLIKWTPDGMAVVVEQKEFEENVQQFYPGFVQVKTFHNLRRLFRDYTFKFQVLRRKKPHGLKLEFRHQFFTRDNPHEVLLVRKSRRRYSMFPIATSSPNNNLKVSSPCSNLAVSMFGGFDSSGNIPCSGDEADPCKQLLSECNTPEISWAVKDFRLNNASANLDQNCAGNKLASYTVEGVQANSFSLNASLKDATRNNKLTKEDMNMLAQSIAKNEMSESEFWQVLARQCELEWRDKSWEGTMKLLNSVAYPELSPLHYKGFYYELSIDEL